MSDEIIYKYKSSSPILLILAAVLNAIAFACVCAHFEKKNHIGKLTGIDQNY